MIIFNLKTYSETTGENLDKSLAEVSSWLESNPSLIQEIGLAPQLFELAVTQRYFSEKYSHSDPGGEEVLAIFSQHLDAIEPGRGTGKIAGANLLDLGISHSILNHSERRLGGIEEVVSTISFYAQSRLRLVVCVEDLEEAEAVARKSPYAVAYEPPELIGGDVSVTDANKKDVEEFIELVHSSGESKAYIGAGIGSGADIRAGQDLGAEGFIVASSFAKAKSKAEALDNFFEGYII
ncbi:MAG: triose-phosphate isomerase [Candidatus Dojkabacteria bacterium]